MAQLSNTFETYDAVGIREELADAIYMITPEETPLVSLASHGPCNTVHPEWQTDDLGAVDTDNSQVEGNDWSYDEISPTTRVGNYTQISEKTFIISASEEESNKAGRSSELARETRKKSQELKIDVSVVLPQRLIDRLAAAGPRDEMGLTRIEGLRRWRLEAFGGELLAALAT